MARSPGPSLSSAVTACLLLAIGPAAAPAADKPLKVFILAGQSNMQGHARISTFDSLADDPKTAPLLKEMRGPDGKPRVCDRVWISSVGCLGDAYSDLREKTGRLTAGFGAPTDKIGPEFTFGLTLEKRLGEPILIIKTAWGGRSLHTDFRPPSAGPEPVNDFTVGQWKKRGLDVAAETGKVRKNGGVFYRHMIDHVKKVLGDVKRVVPDYDPKQGYELAGFVWFQGFNDYVDSWTYPDQNKPGGYDQYADLLGHLVRDVRKDLAAPKMPFVIGVMGIDGEKADKKAPMMHFRQAQRKPATRPEFKGNVVIVETAPFWDDDLDALAQRMDRLNGKLDAEFKKDPKRTREAKDEARKKATDEQFKPEELKRLKAGVSNGGYHYLGAAKILAPMGRAFAEAVLKAEPKKDEPRPKPDADKANSRSEGLHGYISFGHEPLPAKGDYSAGMGFYAAVWPLVDQPLADFQIGLPSAWIQPNNSDNKDRPLAPRARWRGRGRSAGRPGRRCFRPSRAGWATGRATTSGTGSRSSA